MLTGNLTNILGHDDRGDRPLEVLLMAAWGVQRELDRLSLRVMRWINGTLAGSDLPHEPGLATTKTYQPGEMPLPTRPRPGLKSRHQELSSEAASSSSQLKAAVAANRPRLEEEVQTNEMMEHLNEMRDKLNRVRKTFARTEEDRFMWRRLFEDCNKKREEIEWLIQEYKVRSEQLGITKTERPEPAGSVPRGLSPMELLTPCELSQRTEVQDPT